VNRPIPLYRVPDAKLVRYSTSAPLCRAANLRVSQGRTGVGLGNYLNELVFTNRGAHACLLRGYPTRITALTPAGTRRVLRPLRGGTYFGRLIPSDVGPGRHVFLDLATSVACEGGRKPTVRYRDLRFTLPQGGTVSGHVTVRATCGLSMSTFGLPERYVEPKARPGTPGTLRATIHLPAQVQRGTSLVYTVTLSNATATAVTLRPCPGYTENLYASGRKAQGSYQLNCDSVQAIPADASIEYEMRLAVPRDAPSGFAKVGWNLNTPTGPFTGGAVRVAG
jgi:hypothetical protein